MSDVWVEEFFYFGNACWPSDVTYRHNGDKLQVKVELPLKLSEVENRRFSSSVTENVETFLTKYIDTEFIVFNGYKAVNSPNQPDVSPSLFLVGWCDVSTVEGWEQYALDKRIGS
jgi:hypothetical protein